MLLVKRSSAGLRRPRMSIHTRSSDPHEDRDAVATVLRVGEGGFLRTSLLKLRAVSRPRCSGQRMYMASLSSARVRQNPFGRNPHVRAGFSGCASYHWSRTYSTAAPLASAVK
jgi:hypothetical protein